MMKLLMLLVIALPLAGCSQSVKLTINVTDEDGESVSNAVVRIETLKKRFFGAGSNRSDYRTITARANSRGVVSIEFDMVTCDLIYWLSADGYYSPPFHEVYYRIKNQNLFSLQLDEHEKEETVVMRKIKNPIPMFGYGPPSWLGEKLPIHGEYGFDMMAGDFVAPYGKGEVPDFFIRKNYVNDKS